jgi:hypothetical protein
MEKGRAWRLCSSPCAPTGPRCGSSCGGATCARRQTWFRLADPDGQGPTPRREQNCGQGQVGYLIKRLDSAKAVAAELGVTADSVNR